ncbi:TetR/AcrR family transcriptional regulator [Streptomyces sp. NPDC088387]|uniref:TetR/AcrR family transcriptional regulator n=1 Tax=Streptomyces sp. NPDC088387 TaxID=3365859 RepID=UPI003828EC36
MARVSQEHLDARRRQILEGAGICFARNGFHATSMQDVLKEVDLSAGAVYRYFSGKDELIGAIVADVLENVLGLYEGAAKEEHPPTPDVLLPQIVTRLKELPVGLMVNGEWMFPRLMLQVWSEMLRNEELRMVIQPGILRIRAAWETIVGRYKSGGLMPADADADAMARVMLSVVQGFAAHNALFGDVSEETLRDGLRALMSIERSDTPT